MDLRRASRPAVLVVMGLALWLGARALLNPAPEHSVTPLGPWTPGLTLRETFESLPTMGSEPVTARLLDDNGDAWVARWRVLAAAQDRIDTSYFILSDDVFGAAFLGHLLHKARTGVHVRLLIDAAGRRSKDTSVEPLQALASATTAAVRIYHPVLHRILQGFLLLRPAAALTSQHDKILLVDRSAGMIGGRNIDAEYFASPAVLSTAFDDVDVVLEGRSVARVLEAAFDSGYGGERAVPVAAADAPDATQSLLAAYAAMDAWLRTDAKAPLPAVDPRWREALESHPALRGALATRSAPPAQPIEARVLDSVGRRGRPDDPITQGIARLVQSAARRILIESPYLVLSSEAVDLLADASRRGVAITMLTNSPVSTDNALSQAFFLEQWPEILARAPTMRLFVRGDASTVHGKLATFDDRLALVGTYNLDPLSMAVDSEIVVAAWSPRFAQAVDASIETVLRRGQPTVYEYRIARDPQGAAVRDEAGRAVVAFGPRNHCAPEEWTALQLYWTSLRVAETFGFTAIF